MAKRFNRILLKLSGEAIALKNDDGDILSIFDSEKIDEIAEIIKKLHDDGVEVAIVIGGGNIWRGKYGAGVKRARADQMGMLATVMNCLRLEDAVEKAGCRARVMTPIQMNSFTEPYDFRKAIDHLENGTVVIFGGGIGVPYVTTDTTIVVRGSEIGADVLLMAKNIDGIYAEDPRDADGNIRPDVPKFKTISYRECVVRGLDATDVSASDIAEKQKMNMYVFALSDPENILRVVNGEEIGTFVTYDASVETETY